MRSILGERILLARRDLDFNQDELARRIKVNRSYISHIERGDSTNITIDVLLKLSTVLGVSVLYLLGLSDAPLADDGSPIEASADRLVFEVRDAEMRRAIIELIAILREMTPAQQRMFVEMGQKMQRLMESGNEKAPIIIGA